MLGSWCYILAADDDALSIIVFVVLMAISAIGSTIQKARKRKQDEEAGRQRQIAEAEADRQAQKAPPRVVVVDQRPAPPQPSQSPQPSRTPAEIARKQQDILRHRRDAELGKRARAMDAAEARVLGARLAADAARRQVQDAEQATEDHQRQAQSASGTSAMPPIAIDLRSADALRRAILMHEIFSPPKALREGKEIWEVE